MAELSTYIKIDRNIQKWRWYRTPNTVHLFLHLILSANIEEKGFENIVVPRGGLVTSYKHLAEHTGLTVNQVRTSLNHLISTNEITRKSTNKYTLLLINNYAKYQDVTTRTITNKPQTNHNQTTNKPQQLKNISIKALKKEKEEKEKESCVAEGAALQEDANRLTEIPDAYKERFGDDIEAFRKFVGGG